MTTRQHTGTDSACRLPAAGETFLDHVAHFVADAADAAATLARAGFAPTPVSIQVAPDPADGEPRPTGTGNVTAMFDRGYLEVLFKTADTPLGREFETAMQRYRGVHLVAFAVADVAAMHARLAQSSFRVQPLVAMQRPVATSTGEDIAAFSIVRLVPGEMPEGRIQALTHRTEHTVWQPRWLRHPNGAVALADVLIAEADPHEAASRFERFLDRSAVATPFGPALQLDRGRVQLCDAAALTLLLPDLGVPALPFIAAYGVLVASLDRLTASLRAGGIAFERRYDCVVAPFPDALGVGRWVFAEAASAFPWRSDG